MSMVIEFLFYGHCLSDAFPLKCRHTIAVLQYASNYNLKPIVLPCKMLHIASQNHGFCRPKCCILVGGGFFFVVQNKLKEKTAKKFRFERKTAVEPSCPYTRSVVLRVGLTAEIFIVAPMRREVSSR